jgi:hypothetical protein
MAELTSTPPTSRSPTHAELSEVRLRVTADGYWLRVLYAAAARADGRPPGPPRLSSRNSTRC